MINYTLSDDITLTLPVTGLNTGYVNMTIYHNGVGVFSGRAYNDGSTAIKVSLNDVAMQNHGKNDYLKLQPNGELLTSPMVLIDGETMTYSRFLPGQAGNYRVTLRDADTHQNSTSTNILAGYDYVNENIVSGFIENDADSEVGRLMQGCNWVVWHDEDYGRFYNTLLPHVPYKYTRKFGFGLHLGNDKKTNKYAIRSKYGYDVSLGLAQDDSDIMFMNIYDYMQAIRVTSYDEDSIVYLKYQDENGNEFGDTLEEYTLYTGDANIALIRLKRTRKSDGRVEYFGVPRTAQPSFTDFLTGYIEVGKIELDHASQYYNLDTWDANKIINDINTIVYHTANTVGQETAEAKITAYGEFYDFLLVEEDDTYTYEVKPMFDAVYGSEYHLAEFIGTCPICIMDVCYSRYYLAWMDKYGDIMSQAFDGKVEYSEGFEKAEMMDHKMKRRIIRNELQPKWRINSKWINEEYYPFYEAIYTSPYVLLYDTKTDRAWNVIVTDSEYREKTFKNEKKLFNLELNIEANTKQNHIF